MLVDDVGDRLTATLTYERDPSGTPTPTDQQILAVGLPLLETDSKTNADLIQTTLRLPSRPTGVDIYILPSGGAS
jgi:hypothetical protein